MQLKEFSFCCSTREGHASPFAGLPSSSSMDPQHDFMATLRLQIAKDVSAQVSEALKEKDINKTPRHCSHGSSRQSRYDEFYSEYSGDSEDD